MCYQVWPDPMNWGMANLSLETTLRGAPLKLRLGGVFTNARGLAQPNPSKYSSGWRRGPLKVPTLNFAKCAKFRMGHPFSMIGKSPSDLATLQGAPLKLRLGGVFVNASCRCDSQFFSAPRRPL